MKTAALGLRIVIAGGGTGGHLFPAIAIAEEFLKRSKKNDIIFIGTKRGLENRVLNGMGFRLHTIDVEGLKGKNVMNAFKSLIRIPRSIRQSFSLIREFDPHLVIGVGGYASGPALFAAWMIGYKTTIAEQNALPGFTNKILGKFADKIFLSFAETQRWFPEEKIIITGNPVRGGFGERSENIERNDRRFNLLVFGGSQGASSINKAMIDSLEYLKMEKGSIRIVHQTGERDCEAVSLAYRNHDMDAVVVSFIDDMVSAYRDADLLVYRAGATTIAEITASGKAAVLIPYPHAVGNHQELNARVLVSAGAVDMILEQDLNGKLLAEKITELANNPRKVGEMGENAARIGNRRAAEDIVDACLELIQSEREEEI